MSIGENPAQPPKETKALPCVVWRGRLSMWYASQKQMAGILDQTLRQGEIFLTNRGSRGAPDSVRCVEGNVT